MTFDTAEMREIFQRTIIVRKPTFGIVSGYHELPYICLGESFESGSLTTRVKGNVRVSPRFVIKPSHLSPNYEEVFGQGNVDISLAGRVFGFLGFSEKPFECKSDHLELNHLKESVDKVLSESLDALDRMEDITTGVIITPNSRYYPVSIERFIATVLDEEFSV